MARYIDADALESKKFISWTCPEFFDEGAREQQAYQIGWNNAIEAVMENEPTADVVEKKEGSWIFDNSYAYIERYICSSCRESYKVDTFMGKPMWNYCPNCGAEMLGGESNE